MFVLLEGGADAAGYYRVDSVIEAQVFIRPGLITLWICQWFTNCVAEMSHESFVWIMFEYFLNFLHSAIFILYIIEFIQDSRGAALGI